MALTIDNDSFKKWLTNLPRIGLCLEAHGSTLRSWSSTWLHCSAANWMHTAKGHPSFVVPSRPTKHGLLPWRCSRVYFPCQVVDELRPNGLRQIKQLNLVGNMRAALQAIHFPSVVPCKVAQESVDQFCIYISTYLPTISYHYIYIYIPFITLYL